MNTGQASSLMLDLAASQMSYRQRFARERAQVDVVKRARSAKAHAARTR